MTNLPKNKLKLNPQCIISDKKGKKLLGLSFKEVDDNYLVIVMFYQKKRKNQETITLIDLKSKLEEELEMPVFMVDAEDISSQFCVNCEGCSGECKATGKHVIEVIDIHTKTFIPITIEAKEINTNQKDGVI